MRDSLNYKWPYQAVCKCCWWCCKFGAADSKQHLSSRLTLKKQSRWESTGGAVTRDMSAGDSHRLKPLNQWQNEQHPSTEESGCSTPPTTTTTFLAVNSCRSLTVSVAALVHSYHSKSSDHHALTFSFFSVLPAGLHTYRYQDLKMYIDIAMKRLQTCSSSEGRHEINN